MCGFARSILDSFRQGHDGEMHVRRDAVALVLKRELHELPAMTPRPVAGPWRANLSWVDHAGNMKWSRSAPL